MSGFLLGAALAIGVLLTVALYRVWAGPTVFDRLVSVALVTANSLVILVIVGSYLGRVETVVDIALGYALLTFTFPIALGKHFETKRARDEAAMAAGSGTDSASEPQGDGS
ncbi:MAG: pH regulation protein F [Acidimicrobiia bacterium]|nr:pH regulation protein F [Acidimicrobiia bacterium]